MSQKSYADHLQDKIATIYRTYYDNFGPVTVPEGAELHTLWEEWEWEWENVVRVEANDENV